MKYRLVRPLSYERRAEVLEQLAQASSPGFDFFLLIILSCSIATFGLLVNSAAVIIGAMLVAPLMSPILGLSLASVVGEQRVFRHALLALIEGSLLAVLFSAGLAWLGHALPFGALEELPGEVLARTRPRHLTWVLRWRVARRRPTRSPSRTSPPPSPASPLPPRSCPRCVPSALALPCAARQLCSAPSCSS